MKKQLCDLDLPKVAYLDVAKLGFECESCTPSGFLYSAKRLSVHWILNIVYWGMEVLYITRKSFLISIVFFWAQNRGTEWQDISYTNRRHSSQLRQ